MDEIKCIFCNLDAPKVAIQENGFTGKQCLACNLIYLSPKPTFPDFFNWLTHANTDSNELALDGLKRLYAKHQLAVIKEYVLEGDLLEIGSGFGHLVDEARLKGFIPYAIEINHHKADYLTHKMRIMTERRPLSPHSFGDKKFDVIFHADVLQQLYDPFTAFEIMHAKLNDDGYLIFETNNFADIDSRHFPLINNFGYPATQFFLSHQNIKTLLERTGFTLIASRRYSLLPQLRFLHKIETFLNLSALPIKAPYKNLYELSWWQQYKQQNKQFFMGYYFRLLTYLRYGLGARLLEPQAPQTVLYVARKNHKANKIVTS